jgi:hypothetical protein
MRRTIFAAILADLIAANSIQASYKAAGGGSAAGGGGAGGAGAGAGAGAAGSSAGSAGALRAAPAGATSGSGNAGLVVVRVEAAGPPLICSIGIAKNEETAPASGGFSNQELGRALDANDISRRLRCEVGPCL